MLIIIINFDISITLTFQRSVIIYHKTYYWKKKKIYKTIKGLNQTHNKKKDILSNQAKQKQVYFEKKNLCKALIFLISVFIVIKNFKNWYFNTIYSKIQFLFNI